MKKFVVIETTICRDCDLPLPKSRCLGVYDKYDDAQIRLKLEYDEIMSRRQSSNETWIFDCLSPNDSVDVARIIPNSDDEIEYYWHIESLMENRLLMK